MNNPQTQPTNQPNPTRFQLKTWQWVGILVVMVAIAAGFFVWQNYLLRYFGNIDQKSNLNILAEWGICQNNSDCAETQAECCSCRGGGTQTAINQQYLKQWEDQLNKSCQGIGCIGVVTCQPGYPVCQDNQCQFNYVSDDECIKEGGFIQGVDYEKACCNGLSKIYNAEAYHYPNYTSDYDCSLMPTPRNLTCAYCGNGVCGKSETICNCPKDCLSEIAECRGLQDKARKECECLALDGLWDNQCFPLTNDFNVLCTDTNQCEGTCLGENWQSPTGHCSKWTIEKGCQYVLINGKVNFATGCDGKNSQIIDETASWKTYRNKDYGYELKYPQEWIIKEKSQGVWFWRNLSVDDQARNKLGDPLLITVEETEFKTVLEWFENQIQDLIPDKTDITIDGIPGLRYSDTTSIGGCNEDFVFLKDSYLYKVSRHGSTCDYSNEMFDQILKSFKFIQFN